jgi:hemerythrin
MPLLAWTEELSCGLAEVDEQHQRLLRMLNELHEAMLRKEGQKIVGGILARMNDYTIYHFSCEEGLMSRSGYPDLEEHIAEHEDFIQQVHKFQRQFDLGKFGLCIDILRYLSSWLLNHIMGSDKAFAPYVDATSSGPCHLAQT